MTFGASFAILEMMYQVALNGGGRPALLPPWSSERLLVSARVQAVGMTPIKQ